MYANLFCKTCRSIVAFVATAIMFCTNANAQKIFYSPGERNIPSETKTYVVGNVAANTVIWEYMPQSGKSQILIYDESMRLLSRVKADIFESKQIYQLNFINRQTSFDVIAQIHNKRNFYCQLASFNGNGNLLRKVKTLMNKSLAKTYFSGSYECIVSGNKKYFALVKDKLQAPKNQIQLDCSIYYMGDTLQNIITKAINVPYYKDMNTLFSPLNIDNKGSIYFAEYLSQNKSVSSNVIVYRCAALSNDYTSCTADIANKRLGDINIKIDNFRKQCIVYALWSPAGSWEEGGIFSWSVTENMESYKKDTAYTVPGLGAKGQWKDINFSAKDAIALNDNTYTLTLTGTEGRPKNMYSDADNDIITGYYVNTASYSPGLYASSNPQAYQPEAAGKKAAKNIQNHSTDYAYSYAGYTEQPKQVVKKRPSAAPFFNANLLLMRIDNTDNNILWQQNIKSDHDKTAFSFVNRYSLLNAGDALYFICKKFLAKDKESFESIRLDENGEITVRQIMARDTDYQLIVDCGVQVDSRSMVFPCIYQDKTLAFAKYTLD